jgi:hypothetical protein
MAIPTDQLETLSKSPTDMLDCNHLSSAPTAVVRDTSSPEEHREEETGDNTSNETQVILKQLLQQVQQQEISMRKLQDTVDAQNDTLKTTTTTNSSAVPPLKRLVSPERDHPILCPPKAKPACFQDACEASMDLQQLYQVATTPRTASGKKIERPALRMPHRTRILQQSEEVNSMEISALTASIVTASITTPVSAGKPILSLGTKSRSCLVDDDDEDDTTVSEQDRKKGARDFPSPVSFGSCRVGVAKAASPYSHGTSDKVPCPPAYFASPRAPNDCSMTTRLSRATSAPILSYNPRRNVDMPRMPLRLPTRSEEDSSHMDDSSMSTGITTRRTDDTTSSSSCTGKPPAVLPFKSPLLPNKFESIAELERTNHSTGTTSTGTTMPKFPTRHASCSDGMDATSVLLGDGTSVATMEADDVDLPVLAVETNEEPPKQALTATSSLTNTDSCSLSSPRPSSSSSSWTRYKQLSATSTQQQQVASSFCAEKEAVNSMRLPPRRNSSRRGRDIITKQGLAHLHVSCVTLDSAFLDEEKEDWSDEEEEEEQEQQDNAPSSNPDVDDGYEQPQVFVVGCKLADATGEAGRYSGKVTRHGRLPHGEGTMDYDSGKSYKGEWMEGHWNGNGLLQGANGDRYEGEFVRSTRHGRGVYTYKNGDSYDGDFSADKPHGNGTFKFVDGSMYSGGFVFGSFEGRGWYEFAEGRYEGEWKGGCYDGTGTLLLKDGACYRGEFQSGKAHGSGEEVSAFGVTQRGLWKYGDLVQSEDSYEEL